MRRPFALEVNDSKELQHDEDDGDNKQGVNPIACAWDLWADVLAEKAKQPEDDENNDDCPQHEIPLLNG
jgi:hypothetical protein